MAISQIIPYFLLTETNLNGVILTCQEMSEVPKRSFIHKIILKARKKKNIFNFIVRREHVKQSNIIQGMFFIRNDWKINYTLSVVFELKRFSLI